MPVLLHESAVAFLTACLLALSVGPEFLEVYSSVPRRSHCAHKTDVTSHATALQQMLNMESRYRWLPEMLVTDHDMCTASNSSAEAIILMFLVLCVENVA